MKAIPVAPVGPVNLKTGENGFIGPVHEHWSGAILLVRDQHQTLRGLVSAGAVDALERQFPLHAVVTVMHDQTRKRLGRGPHTILGHFPMTLEGLAQINTLQKVTALQMAAFK